MIKAIIFDMDGLLLDSEPIQYESIVETFRAFGARISREEFIEKMLRQGIRSSAVLREKRPDVRAHEYLKLRTEKLLGLVKEKLRPMPHAMEFLENASKRFKTALVTNTSKNQAIPMLDKFGFTDKLDIIICREDYRQAKPHPDPYLLAAEKLGLKSSECVALEDSERGVTAAKDAGMKCIAVPNEMTKDLDFSRADMIVSSLGEIDLKIMNRF